MSPSHSRMLTALTAATFLANCSTPPSPSPTIPTGIPYVDAVIWAVESTDPHALTSMFVLRTVPCTTEKWLFSRPLCPQGKTDGSPLQTMPILSDDTAHLTLDEINSWPGIGEAQLYAVYRTGPYTYSHEYFPAGEYAAAFIPTESASGYGYIFQVTPDGIVRIDHCGVDPNLFSPAGESPGCHGSSIQKIFQEHETEFILGPLPMPDSIPQDTD